MEERERDAPDNGAASPQRRDLTTGRPVSPDRPASVPQYEAVTSRLHVRGAPGVP